MEYEWSERDDVLTTARRGASVSRYESVKQMRERWLKAGAPRHYKERYVAGEGVKRVWTTAARREALEDKQDPWRVKTRVALAELKIKHAELKKKVR